MSTPDAPTTPAAPTTPRVVLITGTSSGIGLHAAVAAARAGWTTVATMRDLDRAVALRAAAAAAGVELDVRRLDVTDAASVAAAVAGVVADHGRLDAVVNNAGAGQVGTAETLSLERFRAAMEVNFFGVVQVTQAAMPHLRASGGRLVTVSSVGGVVGQPFNDAYCAAKFAVEGFCESLAPVAAKVGVSVVVVEPGAVASEFVANAGVALADATPGGTVTGEGRAADDADPYAPLLAAYLERTSGAFAAAQDPAEVGRRLADLLDASDPAFRVQTTAGATAFAGVKLADLDGAAVQGMTSGWV